MAIKIQMQYTNEMLMRVGINKKKALEELRARPDMSMVLATTAKPENFANKVEICFEQLGLRQ